MGKPFSNMMWQIDSTVGGYGGRVMGFQDEGEATEYWLKHQDELYKMKRGSMKFLEIIEEFGKPSLMRGSSPYEIHDTRLLDAPTGILSIHETGWNEEALDCWDSIIYQKGGMYRGWKWKGNLRLSRIIDRIW